MLKQFYANLLCLPDGWSVQNVDQENEKKRVTVKVEYSAAAYFCP